VIPENPCLVCGGKAPPGAFRCDGCAKPKGEPTFRPAAPRPAPQVAGFGPLRDAKDGEGVAVLTADGRMLTDAPEPAAAPPSPFARALEQAHDDAVRLNELAMREAGIPPSTPPAPPPAPGPRDFPDLFSARRSGVGVFGALLGLGPDASPFVNLPFRRGRDDVGDKRRLSCLSNALGLPVVAPANQNEPPIERLARLVGERLPPRLKLTVCAVDPIRAARIARGEPERDDDPVVIEIQKEAPPGVRPMAFGAELERGDVNRWASNPGELEGLADELVRSARVALHNEGDLMRRDDVEWLAASKQMHIVRPGGA
jgi:hypothetical protein